MYGNKSYDPDGKIDHYKWNPIPIANDTKVRLNDEGIANPAFIAPSVSSVTKVRFQLLVTDNKGDRNNDTVNIVINPLHPLISSWGSAGTGKGQFQSPQGIAIEPLFNNVYVVDKGNSRIQAFDIEGHPLTPSAWGSVGQGNGQFNLPENVAFDSRGEYIYVADSGNNRIQKFTPWGGFVKSWGSQCDLLNPIRCKYSNNSTNSTTSLGDGQFRYPQGLAVDFDGNVYVADFGNDRIQKFDSNGTFLLKWGTSCYLKSDRNNYCRDPDGAGPLQKGDGQFYRPKGIAVNPNTDEIYVVDKVNDRIQKFDSNGKFLLKWGSWGIGPGQILNPEGIGIDSRTGDIYVADENNNRIQKFVP